MIHKLWLIDPIDLILYYKLCHAGTAEELAKAIELGIDNMPSATVQITGNYF